MIVSGFLTQIYLELPLNTITTLNILSLIKMGKQKPMVIIPNGKNWPTGEQ